MIKITREFLEKFNPCKNRWDNYLKHYRDWSGTLLEFLELDKISIEDKHWLINQSIPELEKIQREYALMCASRTIDNCNIVEVHEYFSLILFAHNEDILQEIKTDAAYREASSAAYWAADNAADWEAYSVASSVADSAASSAAYWAADWAAGWEASSATDWAAERELQIEVFKGLL